MKAPACKNCNRRGYVYDGPTRVACPACGGSGCRQALVVEKEGHRGAAKRLARKDARALYFELHNEVPLAHSLRQAPCQFCAQIMMEKVDWVDAAHKLRRWKGDDSPENMAAVHHDCHEWQGQNREAEDFFAASAVNIITGGVVPWPLHLKESLISWKTPTLKKPTTP